MNTRETQTHADTCICMGLMMNLVNLHFDEFYILQVSESMGPTYSVQNLWWFLNAA